MASILKDFTIEAAPERVWDALRDFDAVHTRLVPGFVTDCRPEEGARVLTFANGMVAKELLIDIDERARRVAYAVVGGPATHQSASAQVFPEGTSRTRFVWITDVLPCELGPAIDALMDQGVGAMKRALE